MDSLLLEYPPFPSFKALKPDMCLKVGVLFCKGKRKGTKTVLALTQGTFEGAMYSILHDQKPLPAYEKQPYTIFFSICAQMHTCQGTCL